MERTSKWALILGGSSGLGLATAKKLAKHNFGIIVLHRDRKADMALINQEFDEIASKVELHNFNIDAVNPEKKTEVLHKIGERIKGEKINVLVHSIAKGNLKPIHGEENNTLGNQDFHLTIDAMAINLYDWVKTLVTEKLFAHDARVISFTSEGSYKAWENYAAISAAKATLESLTRSIALEFASVGIKANCIQAGMTETKSFKLIPNSDLLREEALKRNPNHRLTTPEDIANVVYLLTRDEAKWITGAVIKVDGGESLR
ncbi:SDR family oxidoreductase [Flagellimonas pacifica]|uniref:Enoyl-[acyl-carrier protein] reductase I n=1 Tax=Flagellimonas pacifica TaxID=1247520 RepID=A0A285MS19_9FLAO|nr:SDR family oxidoreductase [Allomuricauda parva]SNY99999.1 enoyl-[acyl-carrier protein] reductase I [Allomuricauda parva]